MVERVPGWYALLHEGDVVDVTPDRDKAKRWATRPNRDFAPIGGDGTLGYVPTRVIGVPHLGHDHVRRWDL